MRVPKYMICYLGALALIALGSLIALLFLIITSGTIEPPYYNYRLSNTTVPIHYDIAIEPLILEGTFQGHLAVKFNVNEPVKFVYLHQYQMNISGTKLRRENGSKVPIKHAFAYDKWEYWVVESEKKMEKGIYVLEMDFEGSLLKGLVGFYRSSYLDTITNGTKALATTKFEPTYARRAFPCFDEPNKKATYSMTIVHDSVQYPTALSNMPVLRAHHRKDGRTVTEFQKTVPMSTYLVAFIISDFKHLKRSSKSGVEVRTFAAPDRYKQTEFALDVTLQSLDYYDEYFGIPYKDSFPKLDLIAIPDFISGAMENWGLITFREVNLLFDSNQSSAAAQFRVAKVVCHELAHMWFGNLVTMDWWDDLWLNEGFATFTAYVKAMPHIFPHWEPETVFVIESLQETLMPDSELSSHPVIQPIFHADEISAAFDGITYNKGSAIIRMLEGHLGEKVFTDGIRSYMNTFHYGNAKTDDLWRVLSKTSGEDIKSLMDTWTLQMGYPLLTWNGQNRTLSQEWFLIADPEAQKDALWDIPLSYSTQEQKLVLAGRLSQKERTLSPKGGWIKLNVDQKAFYRVNYDLETWFALTQQLKQNHEIFSPADRGQLLDDAFSLSDSNRLNYGVALSLLGYLNRERSFAPWSVALHYFKFSVRMLSFYDQNAAALYQQYARELSNEAYDILGWDDSNSPYGEQRLRTVVLNVACQSGNQKCIAEALQMFNLWLTEGKEISPNYRALVLSLGMERDPSETLWDIVLQRYLLAPPESKADLRRILAQTTNTSLLEKYLELSMNRSLVRAQDYFDVLKSIATNKLGTKLVYEFVKENWDLLVQEFSLEDRYFGRLMRDITDWFHTEEGLQDLKEFFAQNPEAGAGAGARAQAIARIEQNMAWIANNGPEIKEWLENNVDSDFA